MRRVNQFLGTGRTVALGASAAMSCNTVGHSNSSHRAFSQSRPLMGAAPGEKRGWMENFWEANRKCNDIINSTKKPVGPTQVREIWAEVRAHNGGLGPFDGTSNSSGSTDSTSSSSASSGALQSGTAKHQSFNLSVVLLILCSFDLYRRMFMRSTGNGEVSYPYMPYTATSKENRARQNIMNLIWTTEQEKEVYKAGFFNARRQRPLLSFWEYMDEAYPGWMNGNTVTGQQATQAVVGALATMSEYQIVQLTNTLHLKTKGLPNTAAKIDAIVEHCNSLHDGNPAMKMAASMAGAASGGGQMPVMRMSQGADGRMVLTDQNGNQVPVQSMQSLQQSGGLTFQPTGRVADGGTMVGGGGPMILSGAPPGATITSIPTTPQGFSVPPEVGGPDHGTVPLFKQ